MSAASDGPPISQEFFAPRAQSLAKTSHNTQEDMCIFTSSWYSKGYHKGSRRTARERGEGQGQEGSPAQELQCLWSWGAAPSHHVGCPPPWSSLNPALQEFLWRLHLKVITKYQLHFQPGPPLRRRGRVQGSKLIMHGPSVSSPILKLFRGHLINTKEAAIAPEI